MSQAISEVEQSCVSLKVAGAILGICTRTLRREIDRGKLGGFRAGRKWKIRMSELQRYMQNQPIGASHP